MSIYVAKLLNPLRKQANATDADYSVTDNSIDYSKRVGQSYTADNWNMYAKHGHDMERLRSQAETPEMKKAGADGSFSENVSAGYVYALNTEDEWQNHYKDLIEPAWSAVDNGGYTGTLSMDTLKKAVYASVVDMLFDDDHSGWGHATNFIFNRGVKESLGVSLNQYLQIHFNSIHFDNDKSTAYTVPKPADIAGMTAKLNAAKSALTAANQAKADADSILAQANDA